MMHGSRVTPRVRVCHQTRDLYFQGHDQKLPLPSIEQRLREGTEDQFPLRTLSGAMLGVSSWREPPGATLVGEGVVQQEPVGSKVVARDVPKPRRCCACQRGRSTACWPTWPCGRLSRINAEGRGSMLHKYPVAPIGCFLVFNFFWGRVPLYSQPTDKGCRLFFPPWNTLGI